MKYKKVVIKVGTNVLTDSEGFLDKKAMAELVRQISFLKKNGVQVIMVSSGAMGAGRSIIKLPKKTNNIIQRQVLAAVGQTRLMKVYDELFQKEGFLSAQVLTTKEDFRDRHHYLNMKNCLEALLHDQIVPIANENDVISVDELMFTDNDELASLLASMMQVDAMFLLTSVEGVLDNAGRVIELADYKKIESFITTEKSSFGRGGMHTKCRMAKKISDLGISTHIANGKRKGILIDLLEGKKVGTLFPAKKKVSGVKHWIAQSDGQEKGEAWVNECAVEILMNNKKAASLLPVGITRVKGQFKKRDIIKIMNPNGEVIGLGMAQYDAEKARSWILQKGKRPLVHYDYLIIY